VHLLYTHPHVHKHTSNYTVHAVVLSHDTFIQHEGSNTIEGQNAVNIINRDRQTDRQTEKHAHNT